MPTKSLHLRLPDDLHAALVNKADRLGISLNALLIITLRQALKEQFETT